jgi:small acid-soluble spore protein D (minor alpha/beta-type SASP)
MSSKNNNQLNIPQAREAMDKFKMQAASEVGVNLTNGYNGHLTSREAGSVGGQMVKNVCPVRIAKFDRISRISIGYVQVIQYIAAITM